MQAAHLWLYIQSYSLAPAFHSPPLSLRPKTHLAHTSAYSRSAPLWRFLPMAKQRAATFVINHVVSRPPVVHGNISAASIWPTRSSELNVYLSRISSRANLHTQQKVLSIEPSESTHTHITFVLCFRNGKLKPHLVINHWFSLPLLPHHGFFLLNSLNYEAVTVECFCFLFLHW